METKTATATTETKTTTAKAFVPPQAKFVNEVKEASIAVLKHQGVAVRFYQMFKEATDTYKVTRLQFLHYFDSSIPAQYDAKAVPPVTSKTVDAIPAYNRLKYMLRVGSAGIKRTVTAEGRKEKMEARERAFVDFIKAAKLTRPLAQRLLKLVDTGKEGKWTARIIGSVWPVTVEAIKGESKTA